MFLRFQQIVKPGDKVEFNTVDFVESRQSRPCGFGPVHTGNKVDRIGNKVERIRQQSTLLPICCLYRQQSTFNKVEGVEFNFVASVYGALQTADCTTYWLSGSMHSPHHFIRHQRQKQLKNKQNKEEVAK